MTQHTVNGGITRLAQMHDVAMGELRKQRDKWEETKIHQDQTFHFMEAQLEEIRKGLDDVAVMLGIIEPPMPLMPPRAEKPGDEFGREPHQDAP
jgi:hypothetical protein